MIFQTRSSESFGMSVDEIDLTAAKTEYDSIKPEKDNLAIIAVPSYGGRVPALAAQRISKIQSNHVQCIIVCVYGNRAYNITIPAAVFCMKAVEKYMILCYTSYIAARLIKNYIQAAKMNGSF